MIRGHESDLAHREMWFGGDERRDRGVYDKKQGRIVRRSQDYELFLRGLREVAYQLENAARRHVPDRVVPSNILGKEWPESRHLG